MAKTSKAQLMALAKFKADKCDTLTVDLPKGTKDGYKQLAAELGISLTKLIQVGIEEYGRKHAGENPLAKQQTRKSLSPVEEKLLAEFSQLPPDAQRSLMKFLQTINRQADGQ